MGEHVRACIDLNVRVRGRLGTYCGYEDLDGMVAEGDTVTAYEAETGLEFRAVVTEVNPDNRLVYLMLDWQELKERL